MAKLPRITQKIFGKNAPENQITTFGSIKAGAPVYTQSPSQIMNANFEEGWSAAVEDDYAPYRQDRNAVDTALTQQLAYLFQEGIPEWDSGTTYYKGSVVKVVNGNALSFYKSIADNNTASVNVTTSWHKMLEINASNQIVSPTINTPTISGGSMSNGTFSNPTFSGTVNVPLASQSSSTASTIAASIGWVNNPSLSSNVVHKTGNEEINGTKTFLQRIQKSSSIDHTSTTGEVEAQALCTLDKNGNAVGMYNTSRANTVNSNRQRVINSNVTGRNWYDLRVQVSDDGNGAVKCSSGSAVNNQSINLTTSSSFSDVIPTMGWVNNPATSTNVVHRSGDETIAGDKTFTSHILTTSANSFSNIATSLTKGTAPSEDVNSIIAGFDKNGIPTLANTYARVLFSYLSTGTTVAALQAFKPEANSSDRAILGIYYPATGNPYTEAPTPATSDNSTKIATTKWVKSVLSSSGNGLATFNKSSTGGYIKFANGIIIQWGEVSGGANDETVTFPTAFTSYQSYSVSVQHIKGDTSELWPANIAARQPTYFHIYSRGGAVLVNKRWIAVGY